MIRIVRTVHLASRAIQTAVGFTWRATTASGVFVSNRRLNRIVLFGRDAKNGVQVFGGVGAHRLVAQHLLVLVPRQGIVLLRVLLLLLLLALLLLLLLVLFLLLLHLLENVRVLLVQVAEHVVEAPDRRNEGQIGLVALHISQP